MQDTHDDSAAAGPPAAGGGSDLRGLEPGDWLAAIDELGEERGYFEPLGPDHSTIFTDAGATLLVTFETMPEIRERPDAQPLGWSLADAQGWSQLVVLAHETGGWFRAPQVFGYFDRLVDDGFFEDFDRVIFYGAGMCGYAACAFSVAAPGATVIAVQPQATLDPMRAGWDRRFPHARRLDFTGRYGFAPAMIEAADRAFVLYDPEVPADATHAAFFTCANTRLIRMRRFGHGIAQDLLRMGVLPDLLARAAAPEGLGAGDIYRALRARGGYPPYLRNLVRSLQEAGAWLRLARVTRVLTDRFGGRRFTSVHAMALEKLAETGRSLPERTETAGAG